MPDNWLRETLELNILVAVEAFQKRNPRSVVGVSFAVNDVTPPFAIGTTLYSYATARSRDGLDIFRRYRERLDGAVRYEALRVVDFATPSGR